MTTILLGRICRTCLKKSQDMHKLREFIRDDLQIEDMLNQAIPNFDLGMDDIPLPVEICEECLNKVQKSYDFVQVCLNSNKELRNILNQQEQEIEGTLMGGTCEVNPMEILEETDILMDNFKKEPHDENSNASQNRVNGGVEVLSPYHELEAVKLEVEMLSGSHHDDGSSSEEYWPHDSKEDSDNNFFENMAKKPVLDIKPKRKYSRRVPLKRGGTKVCLHCNKVFAKQNLLTKHLSVHDPDNEFVCDVCNYRFSSERKLKTHVTNKHTGVEISLAGGPYPCPDCPMIFQQTRALAAHSVMHSERDFKCQVCDLSLKTMAAVTRHMNCKHPDVLPYKCNICDKAFPVENHLNDHINEHMGYKKHKCDLCEKSFPNTTALKDHVRVHTGESPFLCPHCGKAFKTGNVLRQHLQRHGEKKFHCPECPMKFYVKVNLTKHMSSHTKLKPHVCDICGSAFTRQDSLKAHKFKHSGERPFKCEDCNMSFVFKRHLKRHKITHTGEKPHMCSFCDRAYAASGDLVKHLRTHVGEKTYFCDQCPESFKYAIDLKDHKVMHYKEIRNLQQTQQQDQQEPQEQNVVEKIPEISNETIVMETETAVVTLEELYEVDKNLDD
ncbi:gastrula zinc finger protein XlCGF57.1-like [Lucilia sericata]|uniref:gastrula zinc finger protein XlCGF57.1-like n=1 Tax=Lucilia sericata TaxID=13632 RepID=UPI0018A84ECF|nr:gastrula zinc finger protein XlCGF57.1-like [Lucilia sericata]